MVRLVYRLDGTLIRTNGAGVKAFERTFAVELGFRCDRRSYLRGARTRPWCPVFSRHAIEESAENFADFSTLRFMLHTFYRRPGACLFSVTELFTDCSRSRAAVIGIDGTFVSREIKLRIITCGLLSNSAFGDDEEDRNRLAAVAISAVRTW